MNSIVTWWSSWHGEIRSVMRIVAAAMFMLAAPRSSSPSRSGCRRTGQTAAFGTQIWIGGALEVFGGFLMLLGLFSRPVAFILSGEMAVAYFQFHQPQAFWPTVNGGVGAVITASSGSTSRPPARVRGASATRRPRRSFS